MSRSARDDRDGAVLHRPRTPRGACGPVQYAPPRYCTLRCLEAHNENCRRIPGGPTLSSRALRSPVRGRKRRCPAGERQCWPTAATGTLSTSRRYPAQLLLTQMSARPCTFAIGSLCIRGRSKMIRLLLGRPMESDAIEQRYPRKAREPLAIGIKGYPSECCWRYMM